MYDIKHFRIFFVFLMVFHRVKKHFNNNASWKNASASTYAHFFALFTVSGEKLIKSKFSGNVNNKKYCTQKWTICMHNNGKIKADNSNHKLKMNNTFKRFSFWIDFHLKRIRFLFGIFFFLFLLFSLFQLEPFRNIYNIFSYISSLFFEEKKNKIDLIIFKHNKPLARMMRSKNISNRIKSNKSVLAQVRCWFDVRSVKQDWKATIENKSEQTANHFYEKTKEFLFLWRKNKYRRKENPKPNCEFY